MMILLPRKLHMDDRTQSACLRPALSRVSTKFILNFYFVQIVNPTVLEPPGICFLRPIWEMITGRSKRDTYGLGLNKSKVEFYYTEYVNDFKQTNLKRGDWSIKKAVEDGLTPGKKMLGDKT